MLDDAHRRALAINAQSGALCVIVDAKDASARDFYKKFGYAPLRSEMDAPQWPLRMYLPMKDIRAAYTEAT